MKEFFVGHILDDKMIFSNLLGGFDYDFHSESVS